MSRVLVTGGAGYVGSHCARVLADSGFEVVTFDDLSDGHREAAAGELVVGDLRDRVALFDLLGRGFDAVLHFAAKMQVGESMTHPLDYYDVNVAGTINLVQAMRANGCDKLVFSSTCATYGVPDVVPITEATPQDPINPYGESKLAVEKFLAQGRRTGQLQAVSLRYFNAAGCHPDGSLGESHDPETHLIPVALTAATTGRAMKLFGTDLPTRDGTCLRDYVHVLDLADAHLRAVRRLLDGQPGGVWNLGTGNGSTVREVLDTVREVTGRPLPVDEVAPREGDPPILVADVSKAKRELGWQAERSLRTIVEDAWRWHQNPRF